MTLTDPRQTAGYLLDLRGKGIRNVGVLRALEQTSRAAFAPPEHAHLAQRDIALPLACGQTMPEPLYAARLAEAIDLAPHHKVLEIGTGSGFFTAVMAAMAGEVDTFERFRSLAKQAAQRLRALNLRNITANWDDGLAAPLVAGRYDRIVVHGVIDQVPDVLSNALAPGGHIFAGRVATPGRGAPQDRQWLMRFSRGAPGSYIGRVMGGCRLLPLGQGKALAL
jgi:protein-L-isoaspartate(D-aspartate) O-methyltransferase